MLSGSNPQLVVTTDFLDAVLERAREHGYKQPTGDSHSPADLARAIREVHDKAYTENPATATEEWHYARIDADDYYVQLTRLIEFLEKFTVKAYRIGCAVPLPLILPEDRGFRNTY
jgi:hypothetical protein